MALKLEEVRALADRVAVSHGLDVVDVEYQGGGKHRTLRVFIEKNESERAKLRARIEALEGRRGTGHEAAGTESGGTLDEEQGGDMNGHGESDEEGMDDGREPESGLAGEGDEELKGETEQDASFYVDEDADEALLAGLPNVASLEFLSGITHEDCELFSRDFGTVLDVEELVPGTEYLLEISSPGLDRRLSHAADYRRFAGSLVKLQTFEPVAGNRHWQGRIAELQGDTVVLELGSRQEQKKLRKGAPPPVPGKVEIALGNVEKAQLVPEF